MTGLREHIIRDHAQPIDVVADADDALLRNWHEFEHEPTGWPSHLNHEHDELSARRRARHPDRSRLMTTTVGCDMDWGVFEDTLVLIGCSDSKRDTRRSGAVPARELYIGGLFVEARRWAESWGLEWAVISAMHGVVLPDEKIDSYNVQLDPDREHWLEERLAEHFAEHDVTSVAVLAGGRYVEAVLEAAKPSSVQVWAPFQELPKRGYGYKQWLRRNRNPDWSPA